MTQNSIPIYSTRLIKTGELQVPVVKPIKDKNAAAEILWPYFEGLDREHNVVVYIDPRWMPLGIETVSIGSLVEVSSHQREIFKGAILHSAYAVMLAHNHPGWDSYKPSPADILTTKRSIMTGRIIGIPVVDHLIFDRSGGFTSLKEDEHLNFKEIRKKVEEMLF